MSSTQDRRLDRLSTSSDYEAEAEQTRRRLADNLDALSERLTPGQVFDEMLTYSRAGGGTFARALTNAMRENPVPSFLIGAGCMMFLSEKIGVRPAALSGMFRGSSPSSRTGYEAYAAGARVGGARGTLSGAAAQASDAAGRATHTATAAARDAAASVQSGVRQTTQTAADQASDAAGAVADTMRRTAGAVSDTVSGTAGSVADSARRTAGAVGDTLHGATDALAGTARQTVGAVTDSLSGATGAVSGTIRQTAAAMTESISGAANAMRSTTDDLRDRAAGALQQASRGATGAAGTVRETASSMRGRMVDTADRTRRAALDAARTGRETTASFVAEQPLLAAAIGVAVGAALASLIRPTETENEWLGEASDRVKDAAGQAASEGLESAKNVAAKTAERVKSAAREEGFSPSAVGEAAKKFGEGVEEGVHEGKRAEPGPGPGLAEDNLGSSEPAGGAGAPVDFGAASFRQGRRAEATTGAGPQELTDIQHTGP